MQKIMRQKPCLIAVLAIITVILGCEENPTIPSGNDLTIAALRNAPLEAEIDGNTYRLEVFTWRNFEPPFHVEGRPLIISAHLTEIDSMEIRDSLIVTQIFAILENELWQTTPTGESRPPQPAHKFAFVARNGPLWGPGDSIDVVVEIKDTIGSLHLIRVSNQLIGSAF